MRQSYVTRIWHSIADRGRLLLGRRAERPVDVRGLCRDLLSEKGEASGTAIARDVVDAYQEMSAAEKLDFFRLLATEFSPDVEEVMQAATAYHAGPNPDTLAGVLEAVEPPRQELIRRINLAPEGTAAILAMRGDVLRCLPEHPELRAVDADVQHLLRSWFNRGFLVLRRIDWSTPAATL
jgi:malonyl-CoA decarboxylase